MFKRIFTMLLTLAAAVVIFTQPAHARLTLTIDDPSTNGTDLYIEDGGPLDLADDITGIVETCSGNGLNAACITAFSKPHSGASTVPNLQLHIDFLKWRGDLKITATDTDYSAGATTGTASIFGTALKVDGVSIKFWGDQGNQPFGKGQLIYSLDKSGGNIIRDEVVDSGPVGSLTIEVMLEGQGNDEMNVGITSSLELLQSEGTVDVPNVVGMQEADASLAITNAGLSVGQITTEVSNQPIGEVLSQSPTGGSDASPGTRVSMEVSAGSAPEEVLNAAALSGLWFDPATDGEGINILVGSDSWVIYYYGWRSNGERLWLVSEASTETILFGKSITLDMFVGQNGTFADPDPALDSWGKMTVIFDSCALARAQMSGNDGSKTLNMMRLFSIGDLSCDS